MSIQQINDRVVAALFSKNSDEAYAAIPTVIQTMIGLADVAEHEGFCDRSDRPLPGTLVCTELGDKIVPADVWLYQIGNHWKATMHTEIATWWDGSDPENILGEEVPWDWHRPIADVPRGGTLGWVSTDDHAEVFANAREMHRHFAGAWR